jgi:hypothetical protein
MRWQWAVRLAPAGVLALILGVFLIRDLFVLHAGPPEEPPEPIVEIPVNPDPLLGVKFEPASMRFGVLMLKQFGTFGSPKRLTYSDTGSTNHTLCRIDGKIYLFGKHGNFGGRDRDLEESDSGTPDSARPRKPRGGWRESERPLGQDATGRERIGRQSIYVYGQEQVEVTQTVEIIPGPCAAGETHRRLDTCLVRYHIDNRDQRAHRVGLRFVLDTYIGANDGVPFTIPGSAGLCDTQKEFDAPNLVPDFIQALERPNLEDPGTVAHVTLRLGGRIEPPNRVALCRWDNELVGAGGDESQIKWEFPVRPIGFDSAVVLYWDDRELSAGQVRDVGFAYGLGHVATSAGSRLGLTTGGDLRPETPFTLTAYVSSPLPRETVTLSLPGGLALAEGRLTEDVPPVPPGAVSRNSPVTWKLKANRVGRYTLRVTSSSGESQSLTVTITSRGIFN